MDNHRGMLDIKIMDKLPNAWIKELFRIIKGLIKIFFDGLAI